MPVVPRKAHYKSRRGCTTCKQRHIRCDETLPRCLNCYKHRSDCHYPEAHYRAASGNKPAVESRTYKYIAPMEAPPSLVQNDRSKNGVSMALASMTRCGPRPSKASLRSLTPCLGVSKTMAPDIIEQLVVRKYNFKDFELVMCLRERKIVHIERYLTRDLQLPTRSCPCSYHYLPFGTPGTNSLYLWH